MKLLSRGLVVGSIVILSGCSIFSDGQEYKSAQKTRPLEVPPDLIAPGKDDRFALPSSGVASRAEFERSRTEPKAPSASTNVLPSVPGMRIERQADHRVLVVDVPAEKLWPVVRQFWVDSGFTLARENPEAGVIETEWQENRSKIPEDVIRRTLGRLIDRIYDTGERDKFRTRLERVNANQTEIIISHRGIIELATLTETESKSTWTNRPSDRELEAEYLQRLMVRLGADQTRAQTQTTQALASTAPKANAVRSKDGSQIELSESYDRAWRRVGVAIDRLGFTVEDRDRAKGIFFVRYRDPTVDPASNKKGFFGKLFSSDKIPDSAEQYRVRVAANGEVGARVVILDKAGNPSQDEYAKRMLSLIFDQLK
jgi:outer membrane protein assembly factor BamC